jgi:hypothetical protein
VSPAPAKEHGPDTAKAPGADSRAEARTLDCSVARWVDEA